MRLIDADALREQTVKDAKFAEKNGFMDLKFEREWLVGRIDNQPTVCDIDAIRAEIEQRMQVKPNNFNQHDESDYDRGLYTALNIIDKYTKGASE